MADNIPQPEPRASSRRWPPWVAVIGVAAAVSLACTWLLIHYLNAAAFRPVQLDAEETSRLEAKVARLEQSARAPRSAAAGAGPTPLPYREDAEARRLSFSERELNALLAHNTDLARRLAIDLSSDLASANLLLPLDPDLPLLGGRTLRASAGLELRFDKGRPVVVLRGVSLWGVPLPAAWLGGLKQLDLVEHFGGEPGFWRAFAEGIESLQVEEGRVSIVLRP